MKRIYVCCPGNSVTGGPELLHQLVDALRSRGNNAHIVYYPFDKAFQIPEKYTHYNVAVAASDECGDGIVILPEERTAFVDHFVNSDIYIWWLSVDSYFGKSSRHNGRSYFKYIKRLLNGRSKPMSSLKKYKHLVQSEYAKHFLKRHNIDSLLLSDYLNEAHFSNTQYRFDRKNQVLYNPKKGYRVTSKLIKAFPSIQFIPLQNMSPEEVAAILRESKVYIDFGSHPGKDRFPREAAMAGCCVITGQRGSAKNKVDIAIPEKYKLKENSFSFLEKFEMIVMESLNNYEASFKDFEFYREKISREKNLFDEQVESIFC